MSDPVEHTQPQARRGAGFGVLVVFLAIIGAIVLIPALAAIVGVVIHAIFAVIGAAIALVVGLFAAVFAAGAIGLALLFVALPLLVFVAIGFLIGRSRRHG